MKKTLKKSIVLVILFVLTVANYGFAIEAIATESASVFETGIFKKSYVDLKAYFDDNEKTKEKQANVNDKVTITTVLSPKVDGLLKDGTLKLNLEDSDNVNFKITSVTKDGEENTENSEANNSSNTSNSVIDSKGNIDDISAALKGVVDLQKSEESSENKAVDLQKDTENTATTETSKNETENNVVENTNNATENLVKETNTTDENATNTEGSIDNSTSENTTTEEVNDEAKVIEQVTQEAIEAKKENSNSEFSIASENEIAIKNMLKETKVKITIQYKQGDTVDISNLYKKLKLDLTGTFVNTDLEEIAISEESKLTLEWNYSKDIEVSSEYTKVSPFSISDVNGTIVKNEISVKREITDENYLPIKETSIKIQVPELKGKYPTTVSVNANKLMATKGEEFGAVTFDENNWNYDEKTHTLNIFVKNENDGNAINTQGEDIYVVSYRYEDYISDANVQLGKDITIKVEEYSGKQNNIQEKKIKTEQEKEIDVGELITYSVGTTEEPINKGKINANYYSEIQYETELKTIVNVNVLTSDMLDMILLKGTNDSYIDVNGNVFNAEKDIKYKGVNFNYSEIKSILENNGTIDLLDKDGNIIYTMNSSNTTSDEEAKIELAEYTSNLQIRINSVKTNGNLTVEFVKVIQKSNFEPTAFSTFKSIKSKVVAEIKYVGKDDVYTLKEIETEKALSESYTKAKLSINKDYLTTTQSNENVELKVELNNNEETSDLYKNPYFEIVFPKYVKSVEVQSMNLVYENGLKVKDFHTFSDGEIIKVAVELEGMQNAFVEGNLTNGTNIIINTNITIDDCSPRKQDQLKLYYYNEAVTNYESQSKWSVGKQIPSSIIKSTNGFDAEVIEYQAPTGLVMVNEISNYDGNSSNIKSVKQGTVTDKIERKNETQIARMQLTALNNTGNDCSDVVLLGRIPFEGNKDVITGENLGTNITTTLKDVVQPNSSNVENAAIYYSTNPDANKNLDDTSNGWTQEISNIQDMKSFLIVVNDTVKAGDVLKYTYDFEIPSNLPYEAQIYGSFGAFFNNLTDVAVVYETSIADKVGLITEAGPKLEANISVDKGNNGDVQEYTRLTYTVEVSNKGSIDAENVLATIDVPKNAIVSVKPVADDSKDGDYGYTDSNDRELKLNLGNIKVGESKKATFTLRAIELPNIEEYCKMMGEPSGKDENGYYYSKIIENDQSNDVDEAGNPKSVEKDGKIYYIAFLEENGKEYVYYKAEDGSELSYEEAEEIIKENKKNENITYEKVYVTEVPDYFIETKAHISSSNIGNEFDTETLKNKITKTNFKTETTIDFDRNLNIGSEDVFRTTIKNISDKTLNNVVVTFKSSKYLEYEDATSNKEDTTIASSKEDGSITYEIGTMEADEVVMLTAKLKTLNIPKGEFDFDCYFEISANEISNEKTTIIPQKIVKPYYTAKVVSAVPTKQVKENEEFTISIRVKNEGKKYGNNAKLIFSIPEILSVNNIAYTLDTQAGFLSDGNGSKNIETDIIGLNPDQEISIDIKLYSQNVSGSNNTEVSILPKIENENQDTINLDEIKFTVLNDKLTEDEEQEKIKQTENEEDKKRLDNAEDEVIDKNNNNSNNNSNQSEDKDNNNTNNDNSTNNSNNDLSNNIINNNKNTNNSNSNNSSNEVSNKYSISGLAWLDSNRNGIRDDNEEFINNVKVKLINSKTNESIQNIETDSYGKYVFNDVEVGKYIVGFEYDTSKYDLTVYKSNGVDETKNSDAIKSGNNKNLAVTSQIDIVDSDIQNIDIGLVTTNVFDLKVNKYLSKAIVTTKKGSKEYNIDDKEIAKVEIKAKEMKNATVKLQYKIVIENIGNVEGYAKQIVDYLENGYEFEQNENSIWYLGSDGKLYTKNLDNTNISPGEKRELTLVLTKKLEEPKTIIASNKVELLESFCNDNLADITNNNMSLQTTFISIATGKTVQYISVIIGICMLSGLAYTTITKKPKIKITLKKVYK